MTGGSAKANANFGPGLYEMEFIGLGSDNEILHDWRIAGKMKEAGGFTPKKQHCIEKHLSKTDFLRQFATKLYFSFIKS